MRRKETAFLLEPISLTKPVISTEGFKLYQGKPVKQDSWWKLLKAVVMCGCPCCLELALELEMEGPYFLVTEMVPLLIWEESKKGS